MSSSPAHLRKSPAGLGLERVRVFWLRGDLATRAAQYAEGIGPFMVEDPAIARLWLDVVPHILRGQLPTATPAAVRGAARLMTRLLCDPIWDGLREETRAAWRSFARALPDIGLGPRPDIDERFARAHVVQDALAVLTGLPLGQRAPAGPLGCSSLVALPDLSATGELIHGRNLDFIPHGVDEPPMVCVHHPDRGVPHVSIHHAGGFTPGITATNAEGLSLGVHQNFTRVVSARGRSVMELCLDVIETCRTFGQALEKLRSEPTAGGWTFVISDAKTGRAAAVETDASGAASLFPPHDFLAVANCYRTRKRTEDFAFTGAWREHNWSRLSLLNRAARSVRGAATPEDVANALAEHEDAYDDGRRRAYGNTVSAMHNLDAAVFAPGLDAMWVAVGHTPRNTSDGWVGLKLSSLFDGRAEAVAPIPPRYDGPFRESLRRHSAGCRVLYEGGDPDLAYGLFEEAAELDPTEPLHRVPLAGLLLKEGAAAEAAELFAEVGEAETSPYRQGLAALMQARSLDVLGHRGEARALYRHVPELAEDVDPGLVRRAHQGLERPFAARQVGGIVLDSILGDIPN